MQELTLSSFETQTILLSQPGRINQYIINVPLMGTNSNPSSTPSNGQMSCNSNSGSITASVLPSVTSIVNALSSGGNGDGGGDDRNWWWRISQWLLEASWIGTIRSQLTMRKVSLWGLGYLTMSVAGKHIYKKRHSLKTDKLLPLYVGGGWLPVNAWLYVLQRKLWRLLQLHLWDSRLPVKHLFFPHAIDMVTYFPKKRRIFKLIK